MESSSPVAQLRLRNSWTPRRYFQQRLGLRATSGWCSENVQPSAVPPTEVSTPWASSPSAKQNLLTTVAARKTSLRSAAIPMKLSTYSV
eukprot:9180427-Heterocapsa_arctica.AAC.1